MKKFFYCFALVMLVISNVLWIGEAKNYRNMVSRYEEAFALEKLEDLSDKITAYVDYHNMVEERLGESLKARCLKLAETDPLLLAEDIQYLDIIGHTHYLAKYVGSIGTTDEYGIYFDESWSASLNAC